MNQNLIVEQLTQWMKNFVEQPHPSLGNWAPCPYARAARINNQISIKFCTVAEFIDVIRESMYTLEQKEVVVICFDHHEINPTSLQTWVADTNQNLLMPTGYVVLEDHPNADEYVNGVKMNFGQCGLLILQKLDKLNTASDQLRNKGYYDHWDQAEIDQVVSWRKNEIL